MGSGSGTEKIVRRGPFGEVWLKTPPCEPFKNAAIPQDFGRFRGMADNIVYSHTVHSPIPQEHPCPDKKSSRPDNTLNS